MDTVQEINFIEQKDVREKYISQLEVLDKVKKLFLIPELDMMTTQQIADYYEVNYDVIKKCYQRNKSEIDSDGIVLKMLDFWRGHYVPSKDSKKGSTTFQISDNIQIVVPNAGIKLFSKRAVLRFGMLLRDSAIAKEVRTQLLNTFEHTTEEQRTTDIDQEMSLMLNLVAAFKNNNPAEMLTASAELSDFQKRHIEQLTKANDELATNNKVLAGDILKWEDRACLNKAIRTIAAIQSVPFGLFGKSYMTSCCISMGYY